MQHDKKTALAHQDILLRRSFNAPVPGAVKKEKSEVSKKRANPVKKSKTDTESSKQ